MQWQYCHPTPHILWAHRSRAQVNSQYCNVTSGAARLLSGRGEESQWPNLTHSEYSGMLRHADWYIPTFRRSVVPSCSGSRIQHLLGLISWLVWRRKLSPSRHDVTFPKTWKCGYTAMWTSHLGRSHCCSWWAWRRRWLDYNGTLDTVSNLWLFNWQ